MVANRMRLSLAQKQELQEKVIEEFCGMHWKRSAKVNKMVNELSRAHNSYIWRNEHCGTCGLKGHTSAVCRNIAPRDSNVNAYITQESNLRRTEAMKTEIQSLN